MKAWLQKWAFAVLLIASGGIILIANFTPQTIQSCEVVRRVPMRPIPVAIGIAMVVLSIAAYVIVRFRQIIAPVERRKKR